MIVDQDIGLVLMRNSLFEATERSELANTFVVI